MKFLSVPRSLIIIGGLIAASGSCQEKTRITADGVHELLNKWHQAAARADFDAYFNCMADHAIFIGTDAHEHWTKGEFQEFARPYFETGETWDFTAIGRNIHFSRDGNLVYFDELLDTWMGTCRGSGVIEPIDGSWKIVHYHLSITVPNELIRDFLDLVERHNANQPNL
jgi:ketosteroid isomerase-like protein